MLYSFQTQIGELQILTAIVTFGISPSYEPPVLWLAFDGLRGRKDFKDACDAVVAASRHQSGIPTFDTSGENVSDYLLDWSVRVSQRLILNYIDLWVRKNPDGSLREMVD